MAHSFTKLMAGCAAVILVLFAVACAGQPTPDQTTTPATTTSRAPAQDQAAPAQDQGAPPAQDQAAPPAQNAPAQGQTPAGQQPPQN